MVAGLLGQHPCAYRALAVAAQQIGLRVGILGSGSLSCLPQRLAQPLKALGLRSFGQCHSRLEVADRVVGTTCPARRLGRLVEQRHPLLVGHAQLIREGQRAGELLVGLDKRIGCLQRDGSLDGRRQRPVEVA